MLTEEAVKHRFFEVGVLSEFAVKSEVKELPFHIRDDEGEIILYACNAFSEGGSWLMVCTNKKLLFLDKGMFYGLKKIEIPISKINSISYTSAMLYGTITIYHGSACMELDNVKIAALNPMVNAINQAMGEYEIENTKAFIAPGEAFDYQATIIKQNEQIISLLKDLIEIVKNK